MIIVVLSARKWKSSLCLQPRENCTSEIKWSYKNEQGNIEMLGYLDSSLCFWIFSYTELSFPGCSMCTSLKGIMSCFHVREFCVGEVHMEVVRFEYVLIKHWCHLSSSFWARVSEVGAYWFCQINWPTRPEILLLYLTSARKTGVPGFLPGCWKSEVKYSWLCVNQFNKWASSPAQRAII